MEHTISDVLRVVTQQYLDQINTAAPPSPEKIESDLLTAIQLVFTQENLGLPKGAKWHIPQKLTFSQIAEIMARLYPICRIATSGEGADPAYDLLAIYQTSGPDEGIYVTSDEVFRRIARSYNYTISRKEFEDDLMTALRDIVPRKKRCHDKNLIAVNNGIFNFDTKQLLPFDPDKVFMSKSRVNYDANAQNVTIHNPEDNTDWDVETWMKELADDSEIVDVLWQILGAIIRPNVSWGKSAWFYSETGNNGKGTLCELMRQLCGEGSYAAIPLADMGKDFALEPLTRATAIIEDENDVGTFIDKAANLKALITNDVVQINRKFKTPIPYKFYGFMVQCLNEMPRVKDKSDSFFRRQLFVPFTKCFTGKERKYIKNDYIHRPEVLEYVMKKVLHMNYYELNIPQACKDALDQYREFNDPVRQFADNILPQCKWDLLPWEFLFDLYKAWFKDVSPSGTVIGSTTFKKDLLVCIQDSDLWYYTDKQVRPSHRMDSPEPLLLKYENNGMNKWMNPDYSNSKDRSKRALMNFAMIPSKVKGLQRYQSTGGGSE